MAPTLLRPAFRTSRSFHHPTATPPKKLSQSFFTALSTFRLSITSWNYSSVCARPHHIIFVSVDSSGIVTWAVFVFFLSCVLKYSCGVFRPPTTGCVRAFSSTPRCVGRGLFAAPRVIGAGVHVTIIVLLIPRISWLFFRELSAKLGWFFHLIWCQLNLSKIILNYNVSSARAHWTCTVCGNSFFLFPVGRLLNYVILMDKIKNINLMSQLF